MNNQGTSYGNEDIMFFGTIDSCLDSNRLIVKKTGRIRLVLECLMAGWQTDETWVDFESLKSSAG